MVTRRLVFRQSAKQATCSPNPVEYERITMPHAFTKRLCNISGYITGKEVVRGDVG
jgi:hypothetical protein